MRQPRQCWVQWEPGSRRPGAAAVGALCCQPLYREVKISRRPPAPVRQHLHAGRCSGAAPKVAAKQQDKAGISD